MLTKISPISPKFFCDFCNIKTNNKKDFEKHILTAKHKKLTNVNKKLTEISLKNSFVCEKCKKEYKSRVGLWKHKKCCKEVNNLTDKTDKDLMLFLIKENNEFKNVMLETLKNITHITNNNFHNKTFNLNLFLNETCKNAMNITDFVDSLQLQVGDLEQVGELGYIEGISNIIIKNLNAMDVTERPIHCTDKKRETMYIKDQDKWEKENEEKIKMHKIIRKVTNKNINLIPEFQELYPDYKTISSKYSDQYNKIIIESMGGKGDNEYEKEDKIIKKIAKEVFIDKT
jgi:ribosomal protein L37AE/L43A